MYKNRTKFTATIL